MSTQSGDTRTGSDFGTLLLLRLLGLAFLLRDLLRSLLIGLALLLSGGRLSCRHRGDRSSSGSGGSGNDDRSERIGEGLVARALDLSRSCNSQTPPA